MKKIKKLIGLAISIGLMVQALSYAENLSIHSIIVGPMSGDTAPDDFSILIQLKNNGSPLTRWEFGFYMPRTFLQLGDINPQLIMEICDQRESCRALKIIKNNIEKHDASAGFTTLIGPKSSGDKNKPYILQSGSLYEIKLLHNNQGSPTNYSSLPQSFFILNNQKLIYLPTRKTTYHWLPSNSMNLNSIHEHIESNWINSIPYSKKTKFSIIPQPVHYNIGGKGYSFSDSVIIHNLFFNLSPSMLNLFKAQLMQDLSLQVGVDNQTSTHGIILESIADPTLINNDPEGYRLTIRPEGIAISALNETGIFYAMQTLRQLWQGQKTLPGMTITDYPRFKYRGILLDTARHYFTIDEIEKLIDIMAAQKLNTLHIHFSDDEAFRLDLPDFPSLKAIASVRGGGQTIAPMLFLQANLDATNIPYQQYPQAGTLYQGYYSKEEIRSLIYYANTRKVTLIPEIDLPGHARALIKALPNSLIDKKDQSQFISIQGYSDNVVPVCQYRTGTRFYNTINKILNEIADLFTGQTTIYAQNNEISVGADEVSPEAWNNDSSCSFTISALDRSHKFFQQLAQHNSDLIFSGWQQIVQNENNSLGETILSPKQSGHIYVWNPAHLESLEKVNGIYQAITLAENAYPTVLAFADNTYFDLAYTSDTNEPGFVWATSFSDTAAALASAASADLVINSLMEQSQQANILGIEGTLWSENLTHFKHLLYMALPKMAGLAEASWSSKQTTVLNNRLDWQSLADRLGCGQTGFLAYLNKIYGVTYRGYPNGIMLEVPDYICL